LQQLTIEKKTPADLPAGERTMVKIPLFI